jgi:hypothetical protein
MKLRIDELYCVCRYGDLNDYIIYTEESEADIACHEVNKMLKEHYPNLPQYSVSTLDDHLSEVRQKAMDDELMKSYYN